MTIQPIHLILSYLKKSAAKHGPMAIAACACATFANAQKSSDENLLQVAKFEADLTAFVESGDSDLDNFWKKVTASMACAEPDRDQIIYCTPPKNSDSPFRRVYRKSSNANDGVASRLQQVGFALRDDIDAPADKVAAQLFKGWHKLSGGPPLHERNPCDYTLVLQTSSQAKLNVGLNLGTSEPGNCSSNVRYVNFVFRSKQ